MRYVYTLAALCALAFGQVSADEVREDGPNSNEVAQQSVYDLGIKPEPTVDPTVEVEVETPEGKADRIVVVTGPNCRWCVVYKLQTLNVLKLQSYPIETFDISDEASLAQLNSKYSNIKMNPGKEVNHYYAYPTTFYIRGDQIIRKEAGYRTPVQVKKTLWKPGDKVEPNPVESIRRGFLWNR